MFIQGIQRSEQRLQGVIHNQRRGPPGGERRIAWRADSPTGDFLQRNEIGLLIMNLRRNSCRTFGNIASMRFLKGIGDADQETELIGSGEDVAKIGSSIQIARHDLQMAVMLIGLRSSCAASQ